VVVIILPFLGLIAAVILIWSRPFGWLNLSMFLAGYVFTTLGITIGYHRLFTHKAFKTTRAVTAIFGVLGSMAIQGPILEWVATHRRHHQHTDRAEDPHSPHQHGGTLGQMLRGIVHSHFGWFFDKAPPREVMDRYVPDLIADPLVNRLSRLFGLWALLGLAIPAAIGLAATGTWYGALSGLLWGGLARVFFVHHVTWSVNSVCHIWGRQPFKTRDESRNNSIFGILAMGEGWHNTHHAFPSSARHGLAWWEFDLTFQIIRLLALAGLAHDVKLPSQERIAQKRRCAGTDGCDAPLREGGDCPADDQHPEPSSAHKAGFE
jgi:stearoyl-CoA desaturase (delta-9 desaturase)